MTNPPISRLPFKTAPVIEQKPVGNERCGVLVFPVYHDLTVNETAWIAGEASATNTFSMTSRLALKISKLEGCKPLVAHAFVAKILAKAMGADMKLTEEEDGWTVKYVRELEETALKVVEASLAQQNLLVTCVIRHRLEGMQDWSITDTSSLPNALVEAIYNFAMSEKNKGKPQSMEEANREMEEALGKLQTVAMKSPSRRTGRKSSTASSSSTPATQTSPGNDSDSSPVATPSTV